MTVAEQEANTDMSTMEAIRRLWPHVRSRRRWQVVLLVGMAFVMSFAELATIGAVIPFIAALIAPERVLGNPIAAPVLHALAITQPGQLLLPMSIAFGALGILASVVRLVQFYANIRFSLGLGTELSTSIYRRTLYQPYEVHTRRNSSELIDAISVKTTQLMNNVVLSLVLLCGSVITAVSVILGLVLVDAVTTLATFIGLAAIYAFILRQSRDRIRRSSVEISVQSTLLIKLLQEGLGGIRDVLIGQSQEAYSEAYRKADQELRRAQGYNQLIGLAPRYVIEGIAMCAVALLAYVLSKQPGGVNATLPVLAALALGAQRLLPVMQQIYNSITNIRGHHAPLVDCVLLLEQPIPAGSLASSVKRMEFHQSIVLKDLRFQYSRESGDVLSGVNLSIRRGQKIGIVGKTGSGKSTLIDIFMGLLSPSGGQMLVDGVPLGETNRRSWQLHLSHVPQSIFLIDASIAENIALAAVGEPIDFDRVKQCAAMANISETVERIPGGYHARVGERGAMLSGGQRQRIGIARALYKQADVIVLDEATSALDTRTEQDVMSSINGLGSELTFVIVAHRHSTLADCDLIVELDGGRIIRSGTYHEIFEASR